MPRDLCGGIAFACILQGNWFIYVLLLSKQGMLSVYWAFVTVALAVVASVYFAITIRSFLICACVVTIHWVSMFVTDVTSRQLPNIEKWQLAKHMSIGLVLHLVFLYVIARVCQKHL